MNKYLLIIIILVGTINLFSQGTDCSTADPICTDSTYNFPLQTNNGDAQSGPEYGCLCTQPNPVWYYLNISQAGLINIHIASTCGDIDYAAWGPFSSQTCDPNDLTCGTGGCVCGGNYSAPTGNMVDCAYSTAATEDLTIPNAQVGEWYMVMINNFANCTGNVDFQQTSGTGATDCSIVIPCDITDVTVNVGACDPATNQYDISGDITFNDDPGTGQLIISDGTSQQFFNAPFTSPTSYSLTGFSADGSSHNVYAYFTDEPLCDFTVTYTAPGPCSSCYTNAGPDQPLVCGLTTTLTGDLSPEAPATSTTGQWSGSGTFSNSTNATTDVTVTTYDTFTFTLTETDNVPCTSTDDVIVTFVETPNVSTPVASDAVCDTVYNLSVSDNSTGTGQYASQGNMTGSWSWSGPGTNVSFSPSYTSQNATVTVDSYGTYTFTWNADNNGCTSTASIDVSFNSNPVFDFNTVDETCLGSCDGSATINPISVVSPYTTSPSMPATSLCAGNYTVTLTDDNSCINTGSFTINPGATVQIDSVNLSDVSCYGYNDGTITAYASGGSGALQYAIDSNNYQSTGSFTGLSGGNYTITVVDAGGCQVTQSVTINEPQELTIDVQGDVSICNGFSVTLNASANGGAPPYTYYWDNVPGNQNNIVSPSSNTTYNVYVIDNHNCQSPTESVSVIVSPAVQFNLFSNVDSICPGEYATLVPNISNGIPPYTVYDENGQVVSPPMIVYPETDYTYTYTVYDQCGSSATDSYTIYLYDNPPNNFQAEPTSGCQPLEVTFTETNVNNGNSYLWNFGDDVQSNLSYNENPTHIYNEPGKYDVTLTITSPEGCETINSVSNMITVYPKPKAKFETEPEIVTVISPIVDFYNQSVDADNYIWAFGDDDTSTAVNPNHVFPVYPTGAYMTTLIARTNYGCSDTTKQKIIVQDQHTFYAPTAFTPDNDYVNDYFRVFGNGIDKRNFKLYIFDRWGEIIFETEDYNETWKGTVKGEGTAKAGTYTWLVIYKDFQGIEREEAGAVTVIR